MPKITLSPGQEKTIKTSALFLSIVDASSNFIVYSDDFGSLVGLVGRQYELPNTGSVTFKADGIESVNIEYETANIKVHTSGQGNVRVLNEVVVSEIKKAIQVDANATVENGKMAQLPSNQFEPIPLAKQTIPAGQTVEVFAPRAALNRLCTIQLVTDSDSVGEMRIGSTELNAENGFWFQGNKDMPQAFPWETQTSVFVHNPTVEDIKVVGGETWRT